MNTHSQLTRLNLANAADRAAKEAALQLGLTATMPLTPTRLQQLCALGERMMAAARAKDAAERALKAA